MRVMHMWFAITALALASSCVSAESYSISGTVSYTHLTLPTKRIV